MKMCIVEQKHTNCFHQGVRYLDADEHLHSWSCHTKVSRRCNWRVRSQIKHFAQVSTTV